MISKAQLMVLQNWYIYQHPSHLWPQLLRAFEQEEEEK